MYAATGRILGYTVQTIVGPERQVEGLNWA
jgi:hypothetical protein